MATTATARLATVNLFADDVDRLAEFYVGLFGFKEFTERRTPIFRSLDAGGVQLAFNGPTIYQLLGIPERRFKERLSVRTSFTLDVSDRQEVDDSAARIGHFGGRVIKPAGKTSYNAWQAVLEDPEGNVFRISQRM
jgi:predicted enzyme related to lactoylglutathione lyase